MSAPGSLPAFLALLLALASTVALGQITVSTPAPDLDGAVGGVAVDRLGAVYVADFGDKVWRISPWGDVAVFAEGFYGASGNAVDSQGRLWQASFHGGFLSRVDRDGTSTVVARGLQGPVGVALRESDDGFEAIVCECSANRLARVRLGPGGTVAQSGAAISVFAEHERLSCPNGITRHPDGTFSVVNFSDGHVLHVTAEGAASVLATVPGGGNGHVARVADHLVVTGFRANRLYRVELEGERRGEVSALAGDGSFGGADGGPEAASFSTPNGIAYDPNRDALYVNDYLLPFSQRQTEKPRSALRRIQYPTFLQVLTTAFGANGDLEAMESAYREYKRTRPGRFTEPWANGLGYSWLRNGQERAALRLFELNAASYPQSFNVWDSLAEAHLVLGEREEAIRLYRKSLELNPRNQNAATKLEELGLEP